MKAKDFLEQTADVGTPQPTQAQPSQDPVRTPAGGDELPANTVQIIAAPFSPETIQQAFSDLLIENGFSGIQVEDVKIEQQGTNMTISQENVKSTLIFSYAEDVGPYVTVKTPQGEMVNLDLTPLSPPIVGTAIGNQIDCSNLHPWLNKEALEAIVAAAGMEEKPPAQVEEPKPGEGSGAQGPVQEPPKTELDAKQVPAPAPKAAVSAALPGESLYDIVHKDPKKELREKKVTDLPMPVQ